VHFEVKMNPQIDRGDSVSRRTVLKESAALLVGGAAGAVAASALGAAPATGAAAEVPPLPWKWVKLDPLEAGRRAYRFYKERGGCGTASYLSLLSLLKEKGGYPWTTMPDMLMAHAAAGYGGHGTLCGALGGASTIINMVTYSGKKDEQQNSQIIDRLFWWYAEQDFPTDRFDDLSPLPKQLRVKATSPLCHASVSKWTVAARATIKSDAKIERCAKVAGEVAYTVTLALNEYFDGKWKPPVWKPSKEVWHCVGCHGPDTALAPQKAMHWDQQGHMNCMSCHTDHTKAAAK
jgi:Putative redox-active protein (C_GCAxxG_C_C)